MSYEINRRQFIKGIAAAGALSLAGLPPHPVFASETRESVVKAAEKEGKIVWYDFYERDHGLAILKEFQKDYPFVKDIQYVEIPAAQKLARVLQESLAGGPTTDIFMREPVSLQNLTDQKFAIPVDWRALGVPATSSEIPDSYMVSITTAVAVGAYNSNRVKGADVPKTWDDMVDPKWKGRIGAWSRPIQYVDLCSAWGEDKTRAHVKRLAALHPRLFLGTFPLAQAIGAGEIDIGISTYDGIKRMQRKGAPIQMVALDPVPMSLLYGIVMKHGKNPNTGKLFWAWLNTANGAVTFEKFTDRGNFSVPATETAKFLKGKNVTYFKALDQIAQDKRLNAFDKELSEILQSGK